MRTFLVGSWGSSGLPCWEQNVFNLLKTKTLLVLEHEVRDLPSLFEGWEEDEISLVEAWGELHPFLSVCSPSSFSYMI